MKKIYVALASTISLTIVVYLYFSYWNIPSDIKNIILPASKEISFLEISLLLPDKESKYLLSRQEVILHDKTAIGNIITKIIDSGRRIIFPLKYKRDMRFFINYEDGTSLELSIGKDNYFWVTGGPYFKSTHNINKIIRDSIVSETGSENLGGGR